MTPEQWAAVITAVVAAAGFAINELRKVNDRRREARVALERKREKERADLEALRPDVLRSWQQVVEEVRHERDEIRRERDDLRRAVQEIRRAYTEEISALKVEHERDRLAWAAERARWIDERASIQDELDEMRTLVQTMRYGQQAIDPPGGLQ